MAVGLNVMPDPAWPGLLLTPFLEFGSVAALAFLGWGALRQLGARRPGVHLAIGVAAGVLGSLPFWIAIEVGSPWYALPHGAAWGGPGGARRVVGRPAGSGSGRRRYGRGAGPAAPRSGSALSAAAHRGPDAPPSGVGRSPSASRMSRALACRMRVLRGPMRRRCFSTAPSRSSRGSAKA